MATSTKVVFHLDTLKQKAMESLDYRIGELQKRVDDYDSDAEYQRRLDNWRTAQMEYVLDLAAKVQAGTVTDLELERFKAKEKPDRDRWEHDRNSRTLAELKVMRSKMQGKADSLVADEHGNVALTKTQLSEFFDL